MNSLSKVAVLLLSLIMLTLAACGKATPEPVAISIEMTEYAFTPNQIEVKVGQEVTLTLINRGTLDHELMIGREVMTEQNRPSGYMTDFFAAAKIEPQVIGGEVEEHEGHAGLTVIVKPGEQATLKFTVSKDAVGEWEMGCFEQDGVHYDAGMKGKFIVQP